MMLTADQLCHTGLLRQSCNLEGIRKAVAMVKVVAIEKVVAIVKVVAMVKTAATVMAKQLPFVKTTEQQQNHPTQHFCLTASSHVK